MNFVYNGKHLLAYKIDGPSTGAAEGLAVRYRPAGLLAA
jgi:hypothetical protein